MKNRELYLNYYQILDLNSDCDFKELRKSYRRLVGQWHPDRYNQESKEKDTAEQMIKDINTAYSALSEYSKTYGVLPFESEKQSFRNNDADPIQQTTRQQESDINHERSTYNRQSTNGKEPTNRFSLFIVLTIFAGLIYIAWNFEFGAWKDLLSILDSDNPSDKHHTISTPYKTNPNLAAITEINDDAQSQLRFTYGSSMGDVYGAHGTPTEIKGNVWFYGKSEIHFINGVVSYWKTDISDPLRTYVKPKDNTR